MQINMTRHTSAPDTSIKERDPWGLYVEIRNDIEIFYHLQFCEMVLIYGESGSQARAAQ